MLLTIVVCRTSLVFGSVFHVATTGNNLNSGVESAPWRTLTNAAKNVLAGDTVIVHSGTYNEFLVPSISGKSDSYITFRAANGHHPIIDGTGLPVNGLTGLVNLTDIRFFRIEGFRIRSLTTSKPNDVPVGILVRGRSEGIEIILNEIDNITSTATVDKNLMGRDAHGIAVYGDKLTPIQNVVIRNNELRNLVLGSSEALVVNGNVSDFRIVDNYIHDCDNIGIDAIGFEGISNSPSLDQARNGLIAGNVVWNISSKTNPAYAGEPTAGGIYIDGGREIIVESNDIYSCDIGIEIASEHKNKATSNVFVRSNIIRNNLLGGLFVGGYDNNQTGDVLNCSVTHNTFYNNDTDSNGDEYGQIYVQYRVKKTTFYNNLLFQNFKKKNGYNTFIIHWNDSGMDNIYDYNIFYGPDTPLWVMDGMTLEVFEDYSYLKSTGEHELWGNPNFKSPEKSDFTPSIKSPAIDAAFTYEGSNEELDYYRKPRIIGISPDCGAIETGVQSIKIPRLIVSQNKGKITLLSQMRTGTIYRLESSINLSKWTTMPGHDSLKFLENPFIYEIQNKSAKYIFYRISVY